jgi:alkanesulfonate monooxygenase SsuD/methylene tetrahydromethanopterin reductase-like flavin-dependent oxidoreductase (luciferase family)
MTTTPPARLKLGYHLPETDRPTTWRDIASLSRTAEAVGFSSVWVPDHLLYKFENEPPDAPWECWSMLSAIAAMTSTVEIGPLVLSASFRNPALIAKMAATVDEISGGRLVLGLGAGWHEPEYRSYGFPYDRRASRFAEALTIIHGLLRDGEIDFAGQFHEARECVLIPRGSRPCGIPLMVGSRGEKMLEIALPLVDAWNAWYQWGANSPEGLAPIVDQVDAIGRRVGRDPAAIRKTSAVLVSPDPSHQPIPFNGRVVPAITGDAEQVAEQLTRFSAIGIDELMVVLEPNTEASIEWFGRVIDLMR